jgi:hypothetical protein
MSALMNGELTLSLADLLKHLNAVDGLFHPEGISVMLHVDGSGAIVIVGSDAEVFRFENTSELIVWMGAPARQCMAQRAVGCH